MLIVWAALLGVLPELCSGAVDELERMRITGELRKGCSKRGALPQPPNRVNTTGRLHALRYTMKTPTQSFTRPIDAYIITSDDEHQTEYVSEYDRRREYVSGFSGSSGDAIITHTKAALWTDGRYHLQADEQLNCDWLLMREGQRKVMTRAQWLKSELPRAARIGADPKLMSAAAWNTLLYDLQESTLELVRVDVNLVDKIWEDHYLNQSNKDVFIWDVQYAGKNWTTKVKELRSEIKSMGADAMVVTALSEIAWLLNIRGRDIPYNPFVKSYVIVSEDEVQLYIDMRKLSRNNVTKHLNADTVGQGPYNVKIRSYEKIWSELPSDCQKWRKVLLPTHYVYSKGASQAIYSLVPPDKRLPVPSPIIFMKAKKNPTEIAGMERAHIRDAALMCKFFAYFENRFKHKEIWTETQAVVWLNRIRHEHNMSLGNSFETIAAFGPNGALPHYEPTNATDVEIFANSTLVLDSGGQYYDGTTDVTRTIHFGQPTKEQIDAYTRVLKGQIQLAMLKFPSNMRMELADVMARSPLWENGYNYMQGTGHGIGAFLEVHESPIAIAYSGSAEEQYFKPGYFFSNEPGYYVESEFGVRLENILEVVELTWAKDASGEPFLGFKDVTLVPYESKLIDISMLSTQQRIWLNDYNTRIRTLVGAELKKLKREKDAFFWMMEKTKHIPIYGKASPLSSQPLCILLALTGLVQIVYF